MNNKGFIATSLIYSFFLIFITLFLTIIADYLQNKVLLNTIEGGIKDAINKTKSIENFKIGDIITINNSSNVTIGTTVLPDTSMWVVAGITFDNDNPDDGDQSSIILYNMNPTIDTITSQDINDGKIVTYNWINQDISLSGDNNFTRLTELINTSVDDYLFYDETGSSREIKKNCFKTSYDEITNIYTPNYDDCDATPDPTYFRERIVIAPFNVNLIVNPDAGGGFIVEGVA